MHLASTIYTSFDPFVSIIAATGAEDMQNEIHIRLDLAHVDLFW